MTLLDLINHLKEVFEKEGNLECQIGVPSPMSDEGSHFPIECDGIIVDPEAKTITFT